MAARAPIHTEENALKVQLMGAIETELRARELNQTKSAELLGVSQPDVNHLFKRKVERFSLSKLLYWAEHLDINYRLTLEFIPSQ